MANPVELGLVLEGEDAKRFIEYDDNPEVSEKVLAMAIEGKRLYEENEKKVKEYRKLKKLKK